MSRLLLARGGCGLLQPLSLLVGRRRGCRLARRGGLQVAAFWPQSGGKSSDGEFTDEEIFTAAAMSNRGQGGRSGRRQEAQRGVAAPQPAEEPPPPPRQALWQFALAFTFLTAGAFFIGAAVRKYILQPSSVDLSTDSMESSPGKKGRRRKDNRSMPSMRDLLRNQFPDSLPAPPSTRDALLSSAAVETSRAVNAEMKAAAAAKAAPTSPAAAAAGAARVAATPAVAAVAPTSPAAAPPAAPAAAAPAAAPAAAAPAAAPQQPAAARTSDVASQQAAPPTGSAQQQPQAEQQLAAAATQKAPDLDTWCDTILKPAMAAADAARAASSAAAPLLANEQLWVLSQKTPQGAVALRLLMPMPGGDEQKCVALFQEEADAAAAQRSLQQVLGLPTSLQRLPAAGLLADAGRRGWGAALYASSNGGLGAALGAVEDAALQQQLLDEMRSMRQDMAEVAEGLGEDDGVLLTPGGGGDRAPDAAELLLAVLQQQAVVLGSEVVQDAASLAAAADARAVAAAAEAEAVAECEAEAAAAASAAAAAQQQQQPPAPQQQQAAVADAPPAAGEPAARPAAAGSSGAASWDPTAEKLPQRRSDPDWWLSLPVLHCPQLLYADGSKGLMSVRCSLPMFVGSTVVAGQGLSGDGSGGTGGNSGGGGGGGATAARMSEMRLIAFAEASDAEALADCPVQDPTSPTAIQILSVPPEQLRRHAEANACTVAALPPGALALPPGTDYDAAVRAVVGAVEKQWGEQVVAAARAGATQA